MPTLKNISSKTWQDVRREDSREFSAEEMNSPEVKRALRMGLLIEIPDDNQAAKACRGHRRKRRSGGNHSQLKHKGKHYG
jgi:hypothetical protein